MLKLDADLLDVLQEVLNSTDVARCAPRCPHRRLQSCSPANMETRVNRTPFSQDSSDSSDSESVFSLSNVKNESPMTHWQSLAITYLWLWRCDSSLPGEEQTTNAAHS